MKNLPKIRIRNRVLQEIPKVFRRKRAHRYFSIEEYGIALEGGLEADRIAVEEGYAYSFGRPLPEAIRKPDVISMLGSSAQFVIAYRRDKLARNKIVHCRCEQQSEDLHLVMMYLPEPDLSNYLLAQARVDLDFGRGESGKIPPEQMWTDFAGDLAIAAEWYWFLGYFAEAREQIAKAMKGLEIRKERKQSGPGRADRIRHGCDLFTAWMDLKEGKMPPTEQNLYRTLDLMERYLAGFSSENYSVLSSCESYRVMLRIYSNWFKLEYGIDWPKREEFLNCFPHYCRPYAPAFAQLSDEKKREVEQWYAEVLRLADEWDVAGYYEFVNK
jgi:hypothetical protein